MNRAHTSTLVSIQTDCHIRLHRRLDTIQEEMST